MEIHRSKNYLSFAECVCDECLNAVDKVVLMCDKTYSSDEVYLCKECLTKALEMIEKE